jgi:hypothetical protein
MPSALRQEGDGPLFRTEHLMERLLATHDDFTAEQQGGVPVSPCEPRIVRVR